MPINEIFLLTDLYHSSLNLVPSFTIWICRPSIMLSNTLFVYIFTTDMIDHFLFILLVRDKIFHDSLDLRLVIPFKIYLFTNKEEIYVCWMIIFIAVWIAFFRLHSAVENKEPHIRPSFSRWVATALFSAFLLVFVFSFLFLFLLLWFYKKFELECFVFIVISLS